MYSFLLKFWKESDEMTRSGMPADVACNIIYQAYEVGTSVMKILTATKRDKRHGSWPASLLVLNAYFVGVELFDRMSSNSHISSLDKKCYLF